jgi:hypothetical protein
MPSILCCQTLAASLPGCLFLFYAYWLLFSFMQPPDLVASCYKLPLLELYLIPVMIVACGLSNLRGERDWKFWMQWIALEIFLTVATIVFLALTFNDYQLCANGAKSTNRSYLDIHGVIYWYGIVTLCLYFLLNLFYISVHWRHQERRVLLVENPL